MHQLGPADLASTPILRAQARPGARAHAVSWPQRRRVVGASRPCCRSSCRVAAPVPRALPCEPRAPLQRPCRVSPARRCRARACLRSARPRLIPNTCAPQRPACACCSPCAPSAPQRLLPARLLAVLWLGWALYRNIV